MKKFHIILAILFFLPLLALGFISSVDKDETVSVHEKRQLLSQPDFSMKKWFDGEFMRKFEEYYTDTFPYREKLISYNQNLNYFYHFTPKQDESIAIIPFDESALLEGSENIEIADLLKEEIENIQGTTLSEDETENMPTITPRPQETYVADWTVMPNKPLQAVTPEPPKLEYPEKGEEFKIGTGLLIIGSRAMSVVNTNINAIEKYAAYLEDVSTRLENVDFYCVIVPTSCEFYSPEFYHTENRSQKNMISMCYEMMPSVNAANPYSNLYAHANEYIYFRTDHHWTALGAYYAYLKFCDSANLSPVKLDDFKKGTYEKFIGSFYGYTKEYSQSKQLLKNPDFVDYYMPIVDVEATRHKTTALSGGIKLKMVNDEMSEYSNKYLCFIGGDFPIVKATTSANNGKSCVIIKDSYGNAFAPFLLSHYENLYIVDPRKFNRTDFPAKFKLEDFIEEHKIDDVVLVNNTYNINSSAYARMLYLMFNK